MSSNSTPRRSNKQQPTASTSPPLLPQQHYYPHIALSPQAAYQFQAPQPFPNFQQPQHIPQAPQIQPHHQLSHHQSPFAQSPPQHHLHQAQPMPQPPQIAPQLPSQGQPTSPPSRKRKAPGAIPAADISAMTSSMNQTLGGERGTMGQVKEEDATAEEAAPDPPPKKSRTNTPWTAAEENRLRALKNENKGWGEIAKSFPNRTEGSVKKHWYKDMHHAEFAEDESQALMNAIKEYEAQKWKIIGQKVGKPPKACEQYYKEHFQNRGL